MACELCCCLLPQCEALRICRLRFPIATLPCVYDFETSYGSGSWLQFKLYPHMSCNLIEFCTDFLQWFRSNFFAYFSSMPWMSNISIRKTRERIRKSYWFSQNDLKHETTLTKNFLRKELSCLYRSNNLFHLQLLKKLRLIATGSCNSSRHQRFIRKKFFKIETKENILQKFHDQWKIG